MLICPNESHPDFKALVKKLGSKALAYVQWNKEDKPEEDSQFIVNKQFVDRRISTLKNDLKNYEQSNPRYKEKLKEIETLKEKLINKDDKPLQKVYEDIGIGVVTDASDYIDLVNSGEIPDVKDKWFNYISDIIDVWKDYPELETEVGRLRRKFNESFQKNIEALVNEHSTEKEHISLDRIDAQDKDVSWFRGGTGTLADVANHIAKTIGLTIRSHQNKVEKQNKVDLKGEEVDGKKVNGIQDELNLLVEYSKKSNIPMGDIWKSFIVENNGTSELVRKYNSKGKINEQWKKIDETPELKRFYEFYQDKISEKQSISSFNEGGKYFIPNIEKKSLKSSLKKFSPVLERKIGEDYQEDMSLDLVPIKFNKTMESSKKNEDLAYALLQYSMYANNYSEMSDILPSLRLMQDYLKYNKSDPTRQKQFRSHNNPSKLINAEDTNLWKMIDAQIDMQVLGHMKNEEGSIPLGTKIDEKGNIVQTYFSGGKAGDLLLKYNSLLRIGFSPVGAIANVLFGDISNTIEAIGGQFITYKGLLQASKIFLRQFRDENSVLNTTIHKDLNFLQEMDDYTNLEKVRLAGSSKKITGEKAEEIAYSLQKGGENWIQTRMALGIMIHDGYLTSNGELTDKYTKASDREKQELTDKIQRVNHINHGRYNTKESAAWSQNILYRAISQFRKYIPSAIENRLGEYNPHDPRLQKETEGRYLTIGRKVFKQSLRNPKQAIENLLLPIISAKKALEKGNLTEMEIYNIRKTIAEVIIATASVLMYMGLKSGSYDDRKRRLKNPLVKTGLTMLNRVSGDLTYFYSPANITQLTTNIAPVSKLLEDLGKTIKYTAQGYPFYTEGYIIKSGSYKGANKLYKTVKGELPFAKSIQDVTRILGNKPLEEFR